MADNYDDLFAAPPDNNIQQAQQNNNQQPPNAGEYDSLFSGGPADNTPKQSSFMDAVDAFNAKVTNLAAGELQLFAKGLQKVGVDTTDFQNRLGGVNSTYQDLGKQAEKRSPYASMAGNILGDLTNVVNVAAQSGPAGAQALTTGAGSVLGRVGQSVGLSATEAAAEYGDTDQRLTRGAYAGALGAVGQGALEGLSYGVGKLLSKGVPNEIAGMSKTTPGMVTGNEALQSIETGMSQIPLVGSKNKIKKAAESMEATTHEVLKEMGIGQKKQGELAQELTTNIPIAEASARKATSKIYDEAKNFAEKNNIEIPLSVSKDKAQQILKESQGLTDKGFSFAGLGDAAEPIKNFANSTSIGAKDFESLRKALNSRIQGLKKGQDPDNLEGKLIELKKAMDVDLENTGENVGGKYGEMLKNARNSYIENVLPFKQTGILDKATGKKIIDPDALLNQAAANQKPFQTNAIMKVLSPEGQKSYSTAIIQKMANASMEDVNGITKLNLQTFHNKIAKLGETVDALPAETKQTLKGLQTFISRGNYLLNAAKPSSSIGNWMKGIGISALGIGGAMHGVDMGNVLLAAGGAKAISSMLTSNILAKQLIRLGGSGMNQKTTDNTIMYILKNILPKTAIPAKASSMSEKKESQQ